MIKKSFKINTDFIKLDAFLKLIGEVSTGGQAKIMIQNEEVLLNNTICTLRGKKVRPGDKVSVGENEYFIEAKDE